MFEKIQKIIADQLSIEEAKIVKSALIADDLGADSLDVVDLVMALEEEFEIEIPDEEVEKIKTVEDLVNFVKSKVPDED